MKKWIEWKKREIYPEFVVQINCCTIERNDEHRNGVHRAIIEIQRGLSADVSNPSLPSHYHLYIGRVPEIYRYDKNFNDKIYSFIIANEKRIIQNWEIVPITALNEKEQDNARRVYKLWGNNSNSAQYQINQYISQLEEQEREEFQTQSIAEEQLPLSSPKLIAMEPKLVLDNPKKDRTKGGRPSEAEIDRICFAIIKMFISYQRNKTINNIKDLEDATQKINGQLKVMQSDIRINKRRLDGDKIPGRLFRYLYTNVVKRYSWGYNEEKYERDKKMVAEYRMKYFKAFGADEQLDNRLDKLM